MLVSFDFFLQMLGLYELFSILTNNGINFSQMTFVRAALGFAKKSYCSLSSETANTQLRN